MSSFTSPFLKSTILGREVYLTELDDLSEGQLDLLLVEAQTLVDDLDGAISRRRASGESLDDVQRMTTLRRKSAMFVHGLQNRIAAIQNTRGYQAIRDELAAVTAERDNLRRLLDTYQNNLHSLRA